MAFASFAKSPSPFGNLDNLTDSGDADSGSELAEISTEAVGFHALAGESKVRLIPKWPSDSLPPPTSSLLSVANGKGLLAAAGPDSVIIATTEAVRKAFISPGEDKIKGFEPQLTLNMGMRISQVTFSANEDFLALSAENGGGLAIYEVSSLLQGNTQPAFEVPTNGVALRALLPNPSPEMAQYLAVVTVNGQLMIADLKSKQFMSGVSGQLLRDNVSIASWSNKGKQLVAGLGNGSCVQMTPSGQIQAEFSAPPGLDGEQMVSALNWLEKDIILIAHTPSKLEDSGITPPTTYHLLTRLKPSTQDSSYTYRKFPELSPPFGLQRTPAFQFMSRLTKYPPSLDDVIAVVSTASADISLVTRSQSPLSNDVSEAQVVNAYTTTMMADDSKRASLPMAEDLSDTSPIGMVFDLSSKDKVKKPIPGEEFEESPNPLPALLVLNNEGTLAAWWFIYADSIRQGTIYPGLTAAEGATVEQGRTQQTPSPSKPAQSSGPPFGKSAFSKPAASPGLLGSSQNNPSTSAFGSSNPAGLAFGAPSGLGAKASPWGNNTDTSSGGSAFGQPAFGMPNQLGGASQIATFGSTSGLGSRASPWGGSSATPTASGSAFGQTGKLGTFGSPFGATSTSSGFTSGQAPNSTSGGFASFANTKGFAAAPQSSGSSLFSKSVTNLPFSSNTTPSAFGQPENNQSQSPFSTSAFKLGSTFQRDNPTRNDGSKTNEKPTTSLFGSAFGSALGEAAAAPSKDADMSDGQEESLPTSTTPKAEKAGSAQPVPTPASPRDDDKPALPGPGQLFGTSPSKPDSTPLPTENKTAGFSFGSTAPHAKHNDQSQDTTKPEVSQNNSPKIKDEPLSDDSLSDHGSISSLNEDEAQPPEGFDDNDEEKFNRPDKVPETPTRSPSSPLPPESTSKVSYAVGDSSTSSKSEDALLPPDFAATKPKGSDKPQSDQTDSPRHSVEENESAAEEDGDAEPTGTLDDEGSGIDVGQELSPASSKGSSKATPGSSFGPVISKASPVNLFSPQRPSSPPSNVTPGASLFAAAGNPPLFGESGKPSIPLFASQKPQESPRSPSPVRNDQNQSTLRPDSSRSVTAPDILSGQRMNLSQQSPGLPSSMPRLSAKELRIQERDKLLAARNEHIEQQSQVLSDDEDDYNQIILNSEVAPSRTLDKFIAHQDYVSDEVKPGISGQIENMFRDINSMIDTLGLNSRSLVAFTKGHESSSRPEDGNRKDLDQLEDWCLVDLEDLSSEEDDLQSRLDDQKVQAMPEKLGEIHSIREALSDVKRQTRDLSQSINHTKNPPTSQSNAQKPLNLDQQTQLKDLRKGFAQFQKQLADAEQGLVLLCTKLSSRADGPGTNGKPKLKQPTVEAVENTIRKMTSLISQKSEDIDDLSSKLGDLRVNSPSSSNVLDDPNMQGSRHGSPSSSSPYLRSSQRGLRSSTRRNGYDPRQSANVYQQSPLRGHSSTNRGAPGAADYFTPEEKEVYRARLKTRQEINEVVKGVFNGAQLKVQALD